MKMRLLIILFCILTLQGCTKNQNNLIDNSKKQQTSESTKKSTASLKKEKEHANSQLTINQVSGNNQNAAQSSVYMSLGDGTANTLGHDDHSIQAQYSVPDNQQTIYIYIDQHLVSQTKLKEKSIWNFQKNYWIVVSLKTASM